MPEALFQGLIDGLLILLYMTAAMVLACDLLGVPLAIWMWAIQGVMFAGMFAGLRILAALRSRKDPKKAATQLRLRWVLFLLTGTVVALVCAAKLVMAPVFAGPTLGLGILATLMAAAGLTGLLRVRANAAENPAGK